MSGVLYTTEILRLAASTGAFARLANPQASAEKRSPICGSRVTVDLTLDSEGRISELGQEVRACALGQASAALMGASALGKTAGDLDAASTLLKSWLSGAQDHSGDWPGLDIFAPARAHPGRHAAILLPFEAAAESAHAASAK